MQVSISSKTTPLDKPSGHNLKGAETLTPGQSLCTKALATEQAPPPGHKVRKFHKYIYKLRQYLKLKALWSEQIKRFFNEETDN